MDADFLKLQGQPLTPTTQGLLVATVLCLFGFVYYTFEYEVESKKIGVVQKRIQETEELIATFQGGLTTPEKVQNAKLEIENTGNRIADLKLEMQNIKSGMQGKYVDVLKQLEKEAARSGIALKSFKTEEKSVDREKLSYKEVTVNMKIQSDYQTLVRFLEHLQHIPAVMSVRQLEILRKDELLPKIETALQLELFAL
jgi:Tfp pilus assembly protein PilO